MIIEKRKADKREVPEGTFTPKQSRMIIHGLTESILQFPDMMCVSMNNYPNLIIRPIKVGRSSRYKSGDVYALRDCCAAINGMSHDTYAMYIGKNDEFYSIYHSPHLKPERKDAARLRDCIGSYLKSIGCSLAIVPAGMLVAEDECNHDKMHSAREISGD